MVVPWTGIPMAKFLAQFEPKGSAKYVRFTTLHRPQRDARPAGAVQRHRLALRGGLAPR